MVVTVPLAGIGALGLCCLSFGSLSGIAGVLLGQVMDGLSAIFATVGDGQRAPPQRLLKSSCTQYGVLDLGTPLILEALDSDDFELGLGVLAASKVGGHGVCTKHLGSRQVNRCWGQVRDEHIQCRRLA